MLSDVCWSIYMSIRNKRSRFARCAAVALVAGAVLPAGAANYTWISSQNGLWTDSNNWSPGSVPGASDDILININAIPNIYVTGTQYGHSLTLNSTNTWVIVKSDSTVGYSSLSLA